MRKLVMLAILSIAVTLAGCASKPARLVKASDPDVLKVVTGTIVSVEEKDQGNMTFTTAAASQIASNHGPSVLGGLALAVALVDSANANKYAKYTELKIFNETTKKEELIVSQMANLTKRHLPGHRVRFIETKKGETIYNLTLNPDLENQSL